MTIGVRDLLDDCLQQKGGRIIGRFGSVRPVDNQSLALLASPCLPLTILIRKLAHFFCSSLLCTLLLPSSLYLPTYAIPTLPIVEGQHLHLVAVRKVSAGRMQLPSEQFSGPELPMAPPRPAIDARFYFESGVTSLARRDYIKAAIEFTEAIRLDRILRLRISVAGMPIVTKETSTRLSAITVMLFVSNQIMPLLTTTAEPSIIVRANSTRHSAITARLSASTKITPLPITIEVSSTGIRETTTGRSAISLKRFNSIQIMP